MNNSVEELEKICLAVRQDILKMLANAGSGHTGGSLSCVEIIVSLYFSEMNISSNNPKDFKRDRFILSKGHGCPTLYSVLARKGFFPIEELLTLRKFGTRLQGHPNMKRLPGLESSSGSLGQGLSIANGIALSARLDNNNINVYCLLGDGELNEGQVWEAAMTSAHYNISNLSIIIDRNRLQIDGNTEEVMKTDSLKAKWNAFNWETIEVNGHNIKELLLAYKKAKEINKPVCIIANTIKGKGVASMENQVGWHGIAPKLEDLDKILSELK